MIGKANPRDLAFGALRRRHTRVQQNCDTGVLADLVENPLDGFGIEDQEDAAMPLRRRDGAHRAELGNYVVGYAPHGLPRLLLQRIDAAIGQDTTRSRCTAKAARRFDQRHLCARLCRADGGGYAGGATADDQDIIFSNHFHSYRRKKRWTYYNCVLGDGEYPIFKEQFSVLHKDTHM